MAELVNGQEYIGTPCNPDYGKRDGKPVASLAMLIVEGPCKGIKIPYTVKKWDDKSLKYAIRDMKAAGWKGKSITTFVADIEAAHKSGHRVNFVAKLAEYQGNTWWTVNSIGYTPPQLERSDARTDADVDSWIAGVSGTQNSHPNAPDNHDGDLPF